MARSLVATEIGVKRAKEALIDLGITQTVLAEKRLKYSRSTVSNFFNRKPIAHENFTEICKILKLEWRDIVEIDEEEAIQDNAPESSATAASSKSAKQEFKQIDDKVKQVEKQIRLAFAIAGTVDQVDQAKLTAILNLLRQITNDASVSIIDVQEGSIKLILTGTPEALKMVHSLYRSGELTEVEGIPIEYVNLLVDESEVARNQNIDDLSSDLSKQFGSHPRMKVVEFNAGEKFFLMLVPNGSVEEAWNALDQGNIQDVQPIFSLVTANPTETIQTGQIIDITGDGNTFVMEDRRVSKGSDHDCNDLIFQVKGATINASTLDELILTEEVQPKTDWRTTEIGQPIIKHSGPAIPKKRSSRNPFFLLGLAQKSPSVIPLDIESNEASEIPAENDLPEDALESSIKPSPESPDLETADFTTLEVTEISGEEAEWDPLAAEEIEVKEVLEDLTTDSSSLTSEQPTANSRGEEISIETTTETESEKTAIVVEVDDTDKDTEDEAAEDTLVDTPLLLSDVVGGLGTVTDPSGKLSVIWKFDGGAYQGQVEVVSPTGLENYDLNSIESMQEAIHHALANIIDEVTEGAEFSGDIEELESIVETPISEPTLEEYEFPKEDQPLIGFIDTHLTQGNPDLDYSKIIFGKDSIENESDPTVMTGEGTHQDHVLGIVGATQDNGLGIDEINDDVPLWVSSVVESGKWADALVEFVDAAIASNQPNAVVNLSIDLTQVNPDGSVTTRYEFTPQERAAIEYARQDGVLIVATAGNDAGVMSVLGQASQEFDNIITAGSSDGLTRADYSSYGYGLDIVALGEILEGEVIGSMVDTAVAAAKVTEAIFQVWAANPNLSYRQVITILKETATTINISGWDISTGLLNITAAVGMARTITPVDSEIPATLTPDTWSGEGKVIPMERAITPVDYKIPATLTPNTWSGEGKVTNNPQELAITENIAHSDLVVENSNSDLFSQVISGYYTVEATGKVEFQFIADVSNYQGQLAVISMTGMENLDINSREFLQEALDRAIFGSEEKLGYIINDID